MKFIDEVKLDVKAGKGGDGVISFRHEYRVAKGGPDGGDGGDGGDVYFIGDSGLNTLLPLHLIKNIKGNDGENGKSKNMYGARGEDIYIKVPLGTIVYENDHILCDVVLEKPYLICKGGKGGKGNTRFKSYKNTAPKICENGLNGEKKKITLKLKVMADLGLVGLPSSGKSTIVSILSNAKAKIADYPFTTLVPQLGLVKIYENSFVIADLPGLIKGANLGKGLGIQFLNHIQRCKVIAFVIDFGSSEKNPIEDFQILLNELKTFNQELLEKQFLIIANKSDLEDFDAHFKKFKSKYKNLEIVPFSALTFNDKELANLKEKMFKLILEEKEKENNNNKENEEEVFINYKDNENDQDFVINKLFEGMYEVSGKRIELIYQRNPLNTYDNIMRFNQKIKSIGLWDALIKAGIKNGDTVRILGYQFIWGE